MAAEKRRWPKPGWLGMYERRVSEALSPFPSVEEELGPYRHLFRGRVLNAGAGLRDITSLVDGELINQDIAGGPYIDVVSPIHEIPFENGYFDVIICNAVLEHVANPDDVLTEFSRVTKPGGVLYLTVPFMQPEHLDPTDYQRYTEDGLRLLVQRHGFVVEESGPMHSVYTTLAWMVREWMASGRVSRVIGLIVYPLLVWRARTSTRQVRSIASAYRVIGLRDNE